jgi:arylsulfatase A-like enzyme
MNENGTLVKYGDAPEDYSTDVVRNKSLQFIDERAQDELPFFLFISVYAPHGPSTAAPRHEALFNDLAYPQKPSFREEDLSDKPELIRALTETGDDFDEGDANSLFRARARSLQAADELVEDVILALEKNGQLENTYIIFTSDNGFHLGEHRIPSGKGTPYEEDIRVPFFIRGPGIEPGHHHQPALRQYRHRPHHRRYCERSGSRFRGRAFLSALPAGRDHVMASGIADRVWADPRIYILRLTIPRRQTRPQPGDICRPRNR